MTTFEFSVRVRRARHAVRFSGATISAAVSAYEAWRDGGNSEAEYYGCSQIGSGWTLYQVNDHGGGESIGTVSYNGRVWMDAEMQHEVTA